MSGDGASPQKKILTESSIERLADFDLEILKLLWLEQFGPGGSGGGLTRQRFVEGLRGKTGAGGKLLIPTGKKTEDAALRAHLQRIIVDRPLAFSPRVISKKGPRNKAGGVGLVYSIDAESVVSWASTAFMLVEIQKARQIAIAEFVQQMLASQIIDSSTNKTVTEPGIHGQLATATEWGYIDYYNNHTVMHASKRLWFEHEYLKFVASNLR